MIYRDRPHNQKQNVYFQLRILTSEYITITLLKKSMHINSIFKLIAFLTLQRERPGSYIMPLIYAERLANNSSAVLFVSTRKWQKLSESLPAQRTCPANR